MHLGIDLGTMFSLVATVDAYGNPVAFPDHRDGEQIRTSSLVHVGPDGALVGQPVEDLLEEAPGLPVARGVKLKMGGAEPALIDHQGNAWLPEGITALILRKLLRDVWARADEPIDDVILTAPARSSDRRLRATWAAGRLAGLPVVDLVEEPVAAAAHYGVHAAGRGGTALVYDLGGGTFDATVLRVGEEGIVVLATEEASDLGGNSFDEAIMELIAEQFRLGQRYDPLRDSVASVRLRRYAEAFKRELAAPDWADIRTALLLGGRVQEIALTRHRFDRITGRLIDRSLAVAEAALNAAGHTWETIDEVLLSGGSSVLPAADTAFRRVLGNEGLKVRRHQPHLAVGYGAALLAAQRAGMAGKAPRLRQRLSGMDLGFRVLDPRSRQPAVDVIIPKNTPIPASQTTTYYSNRADQARMVFDVVQRQEAGGPIISLGRFAFPLQHPRLNHPLEITPGYDDQGLVTVVARDPVTGREVRRDFDDSLDPDEARIQNQRELLNRTRLCE